MKVNNFLIITVLSFLVGFIGLVSVTPVRATYEQPEWSSCEQLYCGSSEGTQSREVSHYVCPEGYTVNLFDFTPKDCHKGPIWNLSYAYFEKVVEVETQACTVEEVVACEEEPTPEPCKENCGNPPTFASSSTEAPKPVTCTVKHEVARTWYGDGKLSWANDDQGIQKFSVTYGPTKDQLVYGIDNISADARSIDKPGFTENWNQLWFSVWTWVDGCATVSQPIDP